MKKLIKVAMCAVLAGMVVAAAPVEAASVSKTHSAVATRLPRAKFWETVNGEHSGSTGALTLITTDLDAVITSLNLIHSAGSLIGRKAVLSKDDTTTLVIEAGTGTNGQTVTYTTVFSAAPKIYLTYAESTGASNVAYSSSVNATNFAINGTVAKNINWLAIGAK